MKQNEHIIKDHMAYEYFNLFWNNISLLYKGGILTSSKSVDKFFNKLQLMNSYNRNQCFQGLSEMMFWLYSIRMNYDFEIDKQLHTKSEYNNSDIDIQILKDGYRFNIEVKTPNQIEKDESVFNKYFVSLSPMELACVAQQYHKLTGHTILQAIDKEFSGDSKKALRTIVYATLSPSEYFATRVNDAIKGWGTNDHLLIRILITRDEIDMPQIKQYYKQLFGKDMVQAVKSDISGDYQKLMIELCDH